jgi:hypothetical protein
VDHSTLDAPVRPLAPPSRPISHATRATPLLGAARIRARRVRYDVNADAGRLHPSGFLFLTDIPPLSLSLSLSLSLRFYFSPLGAPRYRSTSLRFARMMDEHGRARGSRVYNQLSEHHSSSDGSSLQLAHYSDPKTNWSYRDPIQLDRLLHPPRRDRALIAARLLSRGRQCARTRKSACLCENACRRRFSPVHRAVAEPAASRLFYFYRIPYSRDFSISGARCPWGPLDLQRGFAGVPSARRIRRTRGQIFNSRDRDLYTIALLSCDLLC